VLHDSIAAKSILGGIEIKQAPAIEDEKLTKEGILKID
jgi:hypothetical protein